MLFSHVHCNQCLCPASIHSKPAPKPVIPVTSVYKTMTVWIRMAFLFTFQYTISFWPITNVTVFWHLVIVILARFAWLLSNFFKTKVCKISDFNIKYFLQVNTWLLSFFYLSIGLLLLRSLHRFTKYT